MPQKPGTLKIGELSRRTQRSVHTIRWYEAQGLMPGVQRDGAGRRLYQEEHVAWLDLMERLRCTGMTISEMRRYAALVKQGKTSIAERHALFAAHRERVLATIEDWKLGLALLDRKIDYYGEWLSTGRRPVVGPYEVTPPLARRPRTPSARPAQTAARSRRR
ncbi:MerR family transcriptional regulator [Rhizobacter sp. J219]|jgi:DNA-binding transcriptional MerR regulator|uniref:MerR family transcriptional regulator n=1 Tax=Rhizobacter sp. J219 TaxID=2898430 RepID=UPI00215138C2|nr:MerR family transcriptional regulator [Rhizobacter sp. J219]MCR5884948.1 MerR family transcriptional regulator [Rhizobacter sp. J219]